MKKIIKICILVFCMILTTGCVETKTTIATTAYPIYYLVSKIGGDVVDVKNISRAKVMQRAQIVDNYQEILEESKVLMRINGLEPYFDLYANTISQSNVEVLDLGLYSSIYDFKRYSYISNGTNEFLVESNFYDNSSFNNIDTYTKDCFLWMDPISMTSMAKTILEYLKEMIPESSVYFENNYSKLVSELALLDAEYEEIRVEKKSVKLATVTASFSCWQKSYGIEIYPLMLSKYGALPNKIQLQAIKDRLIADNVKYIAMENNMDEDMVELVNTLAEELNMEIVYLDNLSELSEDSKKLNEDYIRVMYRNLEVLESIVE